ncbi:unnamed protein product [Bursaphelenchus xylophilus]|uniref:(pine wood nematode) hypothetical protein n=1 Tax=Bursaphelenchus xylophilus TaxID=6326 RepID=A0A1I7S9R8_BURXY|nr:unnamed protein product [Bursaphelenchus xylophilus]CAG9129194.1 unnamed protein product [Bursaphelenchus xylophilus]
MWRQRALAILCVATVVGLVASENVKWVQLEQHTDDFPFDEDAALKAEAAFRQTTENKAAGDIVRRIEKMFNDSVDGYQRSLTEGERKLVELQETSGSFVPQMTFIFAAHCFILLIMIRQLVNL